MRLPVRSRDLRYSTRPILETLDAIVLGGARASAGMPSFKKILDVKDVHGDPGLYHLARTGDGAAGGRVATQVGSSTSHTHGPHVGWEMRMSESAVTRFTGRSDRHAWSRAAG